MKALMPALLGASALLYGCSSTTTTSDNVHINTFKPREHSAHLTQADAMARSQRVSAVAYDLSFKLSSKERFSGTTELSFELSDTRHGLTIDLNQAVIEQLTINGEKVHPQYNGWFISLPEAKLNKGQNTVSISYNRKHSTNGEGLHRFEDPVDGKVYLYSHFEPVAAHQMFPSFDQPDLKATYTLSVEAPKDWYVLSAEKETSVSERADKKFWRFPTTKLLSTYNFSMHAGPYKMWQDNSGKYPLRLFARHSIASQIVPQDWFKYSHQGFDFFEDYFDIPYPFEKYDQVLVPDFLYGAMENAAAITFSERAYLSRGKMSPAQKQSMAQTILHEMAHQWFGNLVTMKWWNGLWLNESFAAFMTYLSAAQATEFTHAWRSFYAGSKQRAYYLDQMNTTHPIEVPVPSSANAFDNIDAITYSKGAAVLRQLNFLLGPDVFRQGVRNYLKQYAYQNATLDDFVSSLAQAAGRDLKQFEKQWLYQAGVNTITADYQCDNGKISGFTINQSKPQHHPVLREQKVNIGLFNLNTQGELIFNRAQDTIYQGAQTSVDSLIGEQCPDLVYPNYQDWGFVKVNLDQKSFNTVKSAISTVADPLLRSMLWQSLSDSVSDGLLPLNQFIDVLLANIEKEQDYTMMRQLSGKLRTALGYLSGFDDDVAEYRNRQSKRLAQMAWQQLLQNQNNNQIQRVWYGLFSAAANTPDGLKKLHALLTGELEVKGVTINQDRRWSIIAQLNRYDYPGSLELIEQEKLNDRSDSGLKRALSAKASRPDPQEKAYWLAQLNHPEPDYAYPMLRSVMGSLFPGNQSKLQEQYADQIINGLQTLEKQQNPVFMRSYSSVIPSLCTKSNLTRLTKAVEQLQHLSDLTKRNLMTKQYLNQQCLNIRDRLVM